MGELEGDDVSVTTTSTPDTVALLRRACAAEPTDVTARLIYAEAIQEAGDELAATLQRCVAQPDDDTHYTNLAALYEANGERERGEFVRVQVELANRTGERYGCRKCTSSAVVIPAFSEEECWCRFKPAVARERELRAANEVRWRAAGKCKRCVGTGKVPPFSYSCDSCYGSGDVGGLMQREKTPSVTDSSIGTEDWRHPVHFVRGVITRVDCALSECGTVEQVTCPKCEGQKGRMNPSGGFREFSGSYPTWENCHHCQGNGTVPRWVPSSWARAVLRSHVTVAQLWVTNREPSRDRDSGSYFWGGADGSQPDGTHYLPHVLHGELGKHPVLYSTADLARTALAVALVTLTRAAVESQD